MRLAILNLTQGGLSGGYQKYLKHLVPLLQENERVSALALAVPPGYESSLDLDPQRTEVRAWPNARWLLRRPQFPAWIADWKPDVVFIPTARWLDTGGVPTVVMVRNMEPLIAPFGGNTMVEGLKNLVRAREARTAASQATRTIAVSHHVAEFVIRRWETDPSAVGVVYHGVEGPVRPHEPDSVTTGRDVSSGDFLFTAGSIRPARGLEELVRALGILRAAGIREQLVIAGSTDHRRQPYLRRVKALADRLGVAEQLHWAGQQSAEGMSWYFSNCKCFIMSSRVEACPNTLLEAMAHGCLILAPSVGPMPEILGPTGKYYSAQDPENMARELGDTLIMPTAQASELKTRARRRSSLFDWASSATKTVEQLEQASGA